MEGAPATTEATTDAPPKDNEGGDGDKDGEVTTRTITVEEDNDNTEDNKEKQSSNEGPKAINLGKCSEPDHEHDPFTNECKPVYTGCGILFPDTNSCTNAPSQIQGDDNSVAVAAAQTGDNTADVSQDETNEQSNVLVTGDNEATSR